MHQKIRYALIGCGSMGREHIENIKTLDGTEITAIADPNASSRAAAQALIPGPARAFDNYPVSYTHLTLPTSDLV